MPLKRLLACTGAAGTVIPSPPGILWMLFNGTALDLDYDIGFATTADLGVTWTPDIGNPIIVKGAAGTWDDASLVQPSLIWDGSQWVLYLAGYDGSRFVIGRWTNPNADLSAHPTAWTPDGANPVLTGPGGGVGFHAGGLNVPMALFESAFTRLWYTGKSDTGVFTIGYADNSGGPWAGPGQVLGLGSAGTFDDAGLACGPVVKIASTYYMLYDGYDGANWHAGYATCTDPNDASTYTKHGVLSAFVGDITLPGDGRTYRSNGLTSVVERGGTYIGFGTAFHPTDASGDEVSIRSTSTDLINWSVPTGPLIPLSGWTSNSAENPAVVAA